MAMTAGRFAATAKRAVIGLTRCTVCGNRIKRVGYHEKLQGKHHWLCPHCHDEISRLRSQQAMNKFRENKFDL